MGETAQQIHQHRPGQRVHAVLLRVGLLLSVLFAGSAAAQDPGLTLAGPGVLGGTVAQPEFLPVEEAYPLAVERGDERRLRLVWQMPAGYYLYQHAFRFQLVQDGEALGVEPVFPPALEREDEYFGRVQVYYDSADIELTAVAPIADAQLVVTSQGCADAGLCYPPRTQRFAISADGGITEVASGIAAGRTAAGPPDLGAPGTAAGDLGTLLFMMLLSFLGGTILNLMPCVLPILSLKVLSFAAAPAAERHRHGLYYSVGVITSFLVVAALLLALRSAGEAIGWGFQLQSPTFVIGLAYLFVVLGLAMSGAIELGSGLMNLGGDLAARGGIAGSFFTGVLAVVVASPCTAPFMGTALGYALVQPPLAGVAVFAALGAGMAAPMLLLSYSEFARRLTPRPGPWMERLKQALAFPLYATALWLFWVAGRQVGVDVMAASLLGALLLALALWLWCGALIARSVALLAVVLAISLAGWRPEPSGAGDNALPAGSVAYSATALQDLRAQGRPVFVDVTADWCITCLANERAVLNTPSVRQAFRDAGVTYMVADWTDYDPGIADFVASHGRSGIPLYVLYDGREAPRLLPQLLRRQTVLDALETLNRGDLAAGPSR